MLPERLFLTGGSGFVGRNLIRHFTARGVEVLALARSPASAIIVEELGARPVEGDVLAPGLERAMTGSQWLIHAAADTGHGHGTSEQARVNLDGTRNVFKSARSAGVGRALIISTESVLLDGRPLMDAAEDHPLPRRPAGSYSRTKAAAERMALSCAGPDFEVVAIRPRFVWGRDDTTAMPNLLDAARSGRMAWINGGQYQTSTTHIANLCEGVARALERGRSGEVYFIADEAPVIFRDFVTRLLATQGVNPPTKSVPRWVLRSLAEVSDMVAKISRGRITGPLSRQEYATMAVEVTVSTAKARKELGYRPVISIDEGLAELTVMRELRPRPDELHGDFAGVAAAQ